MDLQTYINENRISKKNKPGADHVHRWQTRVLPLGLHLKGEQGAADYLAAYGGAVICAPKCIAFARYAESVDCSAMALGFWKKAFSLEHPGDEFGEIDAPPANTVTNGGVEGVPVQRVIHLPTYAMFPHLMRPGELDPMQPSDAKHPRAYYIKNSDYWGQPKRNGEKRIIFATPDAVYYQTRSMRIEGAPLGADQDFEPALKECAAELGAFILEGEFFYLDCQGDEYISAATCASVNVEKGSKSLPVFVFSPFACLFVNGESLLRQDERVTTGFVIAEMLARHTDSVRSLATARTEAEKQELCRVQVREGRDGEVWFCHAMPYVSGKTSSDSIVRTKYKTDPTLYFIHAMTKSTAANRLIGAIQLIDTNGKNVGSAGGSIPLAKQQEIVRRFNDEGADSVAVLIVSRGFTAGGKLREGVFYDLAPAPEK